MNQLTITSHVDADGVLRVALPLGVAEANKTVEVTVKSIHKKSTTLEEHRAFIDKTYGAWQGELERPEQLPLEERDWSS